MNKKMMRTIRKQMVPIGLTAVLLLGTIIVFIAGLNTPAQKQTTTTAVSYNLQGNFTEQAYGKAASASAAKNMVFFPKIITNSTGTYTYNFTGAKTINDLQSSVRISAVLSRPGVWSKIIEILPSKTISSGTVTFPLDISGFLAKANQISQELGLGTSSSIEVTLLATVNTTATIDGVTVKDSFTQTSKMALTSTILEWNLPLTASRKGLQDGKAFEHQGQFGYEFTLAGNTLYGVATLKSAPAATSVDELKTLPQKTAYQADEISFMRVNFNYNVVVDYPLSGVNHEIQATALLTNTRGNQTVFPLLSKTQYQADFAVEFPVDVELLYDLIRKTEGISNFDFDDTYQYLIKVDVTTTATKPGVVNKTLSTVLPLKITNSGVTVGEVKNKAINGEVTKTESIPNPARSTLMMVALSLFFLTLVAGLWLAWLVWESRKVVPIVKERWDATQDIAQRHKSILVTVQELPTTAVGERVVQLDTLEELVKLADSLLKPVLHFKDGDSHVFAVMEGTVRFVYLIIEPPVK